MGKIADGTSEVKVEGLANFGRFLIWLLRRLSLAIPWGPVELAIAISVGVMAWQCGYGVAGGWLGERLCSQNEITTATVTKHLQHGGIEAIYTVSGATYRAAGRGTHRTPIGGPVAVYFDPRQPAVSSTVPPIELLREGQRSGAMMATWILAFLAVERILRGRSRWEGVWHWRALDATVSALLVAAAIPFLLLGGSSAGLQYLGRGMVEPPLERALLGAAGSIVVISAGGLYCRLFCPGYWKSVLSQTPSAMLGIACLAAAVATGVSVTNAIVAGNLE